MNRKGRKRKSGRRTASGALPRIRVDYRAMAAAQPHRKWLPEALRESERAESVLGCLNLIKRISEQQYEAGRRYSVIVGAYRAVIGVPGHMVGNGRGYDCSQAACVVDPDSCICLVRTQAYQRAYEAISRVSRKAHLAINRVAIHNELCSHEQLSHLRDGLDALARHFGLTNHRKSA